jgi:hypothetical protein
VAGCDDASGRDYRARRGRLKKTFEYQRHQYGF